MKSSSALTLITFIFFGCTQNSNEDIKSNSKIDTTKNDKFIKKITLNQEKKAINIEELNKLIPIEIVDPKSTNVYEKYGLEFSGNCYACDLANLSISEKSIKLTNAVSYTHLRAHETEL
jgi:hypothetical protein